MIKGQNNFIHKKINLKRKQV